ncbi:MAG: Holliday junction resolvase RecU [Chloroflexota bacterium]
MKSALSFLDEQQVEDLASCCGRPDPGNVLEGELIDTHRQLVRMGLGLIIKLFVPMVATRHGGKGRRGWAPTQKTVFDYGGVLRNAGPVSFDAKERDTDSGAGYRFSYSNVRPHQWAALAAYEGWGFAGFVFVGMKEGGEVLRAALVKPSWIQKGSGVDLRDCPLVMREGIGFWPWHRLVVNYDLWKRRAELW